MPSRQPVDRPRVRSRPARWLAAVAAAACIASGLLGASIALPAAVAGIGPLPACRYDDILTAPRDYDDWPVTLVDTILRVTKDYVPPHLTDVSDAGIAGSGKIRTVAVADLAAMTAAAKAAGNAIAVQSAYRSYATQQSTFQYWVNLVGYKQALLYSARPGHSEHQLGLAIDFKSAGAGSPFEGDWGLTAAGRWMRLHAWEFGWLESYPKGEQSKTCYAYEAWHFRYVGRTLAAKIHASGLTTREYLWAHFTTAIVPPVSPAPASPRPSVEPSSGPSVGPSPSASPSEGPSATPEQASPSPAVTTLPGSPGPSETGAAGGGSPDASGATLDPEPLVLTIGMSLVIFAVGALAVGRRRSRSGPGL